MDSGNRNSPKLSRLMQRGASSSPSNEQFKGIISFSTKNNEDISGLDEAMETFRASSASCSSNITNVKSTPLSPTVAETPNTGPSIDRTPSTTDFEMAVDATTVGDDSTSFSRLADQSSSATYPTELYTGVNHTSDIGPDRGDRTDSEIDFPIPELQSYIETEADSANPITSRPLSSQSHSIAEQNNLIAASEIHALLDSFAPTGHASSVGAALPTVDVPLEESGDPPVATEQTSVHEFESLQKECTLFELDKESRNAYPSDSVMHSDPPGHSPRHSIVNDLGGSPVLRKRSVTPQTQAHSPGVYAPTSWKFQSHNQTTSMKRAQATKSVCIYVLSLLVLMVASFYLLSSFFRGLVCGVACTYCFVRIRQLIWGDVVQCKCPISGTILSRSCCSLHSQLARGVDMNDLWWPIYAPALPPLNVKRGPPQLRDLQSFSVPHMTDEDPNTSAASGPLGTGLGFKLDKHDRPVYKGWMNETSSYNPETHHVSRTHSVFVTLDGTQLRLQRPRRNIARRSMWNEELPPTSTMRFQQQRIFDLVHARVTLLPTGLVFKRLWSKKYPIAITIPKKPHNSPVARSSLPSSTSVPNMVSSVPQPSSPVRGEGAAVLSELHSRSRSPTPAELTEVVDGFTMLSHSDVAAETLYLFGRTCREKETWYARLRAASLGIPLLWTPQLAVQAYLATTGFSNTLSSTNNTVGGQENRSDDEEAHDKDSTTTASVSDGANTSCDKSNLQLPIAGSREPLYVTYVRYMAKFMPASWLLRGTQALRLNVNYVSCDSQVMWLNALLARVFWDFLREVYWLERVRDKIQAKLKKIHLPPFISDLIVVGIDLGTELPVIRRIGRPFLDAHGLWFELDVAYAGGFSVALETNVNLMRWNQKTRESANLADDLSSNSPPTLITGEQNFNTLGRRSNKLGAFLSDEEDSADSTTDSDMTVEPSPLNTSPSGLRRSSGSGRLLGSPAGLTSLSSRGIEEERTNGSDSPQFERPSWKLSASLSLTMGTLNLPSALPSRRRFIRIVDRITRSTYFQKAVDNKLVQRGMELLSNTPIVLEAEIQMLTGTLLINIPPPPSDRLWYGFRPNPQLRLKAKPRVGEKAVTMSRILEWIEKRVALEFQRLIVLPNMDDISIPLLLSDVSAG